jgi:hypothetical protein
MKDEALFCRFFASPTKKHNHPVMSTRNINAIDQGSSSVRYCNTSKDHKRTVSSRVSGWEITIGFVLGGRITV